MRNISTVSGLRAIWSRRGYASMEGLTQSRRNALALLALAEVAISLT